MDTKSSRHHLIKCLPLVLLSGLLAVSLLLSPVVLGSSSHQAFAVTSAEKQAEVDEALVRLDALQTEINQINLDYDAAIIAHAEAEEKMYDAQAREDAARKRIAELQEQLGERASHMYRNGNGSYMDVLFGAQTFTDFITVMDLLNRVNEQDAHLVLETKSVRMEAEEARIEYTAQEQITREKQEQIETLKTEKEAASASLQEVIIVLQAEVAELKLAEEIAAEEARKLAANLGVVALGEVNDEQIARIAALGLVYPFGSRQTISSGFGYRSFDGNFHRGVDFAAAGGTPILSIASGTIFQTGYSSSMGNYIFVSHGNGVFSTYMHASSLNCSVGQAVGAGETIAFVGTTGNSTGNHLHLEITLNGPSYAAGCEWVNPLIFFN